MGTAVQVAPRKLAVDSDEAFSRALGTVAKKVRVPDEDIVRGLRARDRMTWSRFRFDLAREVSVILTERFPQIRAVHLWELDEGTPEAVGAPAEPTVDLILTVPRIPAGLDDLAVGLGKELTRTFTAQVPETPLVLTVHLLTQAMISAGKGMAALFRSVHQRPALIWSSD
jgi:hypothetical protein